VFGVALLPGKVEQGTVSGQRRPQVQLRQVPAGPGDQRRGRAAQIHTHHDADGDEHRLDQDPEVLPPGPDPGDALLGDAPKNHR